MANNTISQIEINNTTYDLLDTNTLSAVSAIEKRVTNLESYKITATTVELPSTITLVSGGYYTISGELLPVQKNKCLGLFIHYYLTISPTGGITAALGSVNSTNVGGYIIGTGNQVIKNLYVNYLHYV